MKEHTFNTPEGIVVTIRVPDGNAVSVEDSHFSNEVVTVNNREYKLDNPDLLNGFDMEMFCTLVADDVIDKFNIEELTGEALFLEHRHFAYLINACDQSTPIAFLEDVYISIGTLLQSILEQCTCPWPPDDDSEEVLAGIIKEDFINSVKA